MSQTRHMIIARYIGKLDRVNCMHTQHNRLNCTLHICGVLEAGHSSGAAAVKLTHRWATLDWWAESVVVAGGVCWDGGSVGARCICGVLEAGHRGRAAAVVGGWGTSWCDWAQARQRRQNHPQRLTSRSSDVGAVVTFSVITGLQLWSTTVCLYNAAGCLGWPFPMLKY